MTNCTTKGRTGEINYTVHYLQKSCRKRDMAGFCKLGQRVLLCKWDLTWVSHRSLVCYTSRKRKAYPVHRAQPACLGWGV